MADNHRDRRHRAPPFHPQVGLGNYSVWPPTVASFANGHLYVPMPPLFVAEVYNQMQYGLQRAWPSFQCPNIQWQAQAPLPWHPYQFSSHWQALQYPVLQPPTMPRQALAAPLWQPPTMQQRQAAPAVHTVAQAPLPWHLYQFSSHWQALQYPALQPPTMPRQAPPAPLWQPPTMQQRQATPAVHTVAPPPPPPMETVHTLTPPNDSTGICQRFRATGICKYGTSCKKSHPDEDRMTSYPHRPEAEECKYFIDSGFCVRGLRCRCHHPTDKIKPAEMAPEVTRTGFARRPGMVKCPHYQHGSCVLRAYCKFDHPEE